MFMFKLLYEAVKNFVKILLVILIISQFYIICFHTIDTYMHCPLLLTWALHGFKRGQTKSCRSCSRRFPLQWWFGTSDSHLSSHILSHVSHT